MSMIGWLLAVSPAQVGSLQQAPALVADLVRMAQEDSWRLAGYAQEETAETKQRRANLAHAAPFAEALCLEKSWDILQHLLTGYPGDEAAPGNMLMTGTALGEDAGYGPTVLHDVAETQDFARFLAATGMAEVEGRATYASLSSSGTYGLPGGGNVSPAEFEEDIRAEVRGYLPKLQRYVSSAASSGHGLLFWIS